MSVKRSPGERKMMVTLIGCVSRKAPGARPARDLYDSELFRRRREFAERSGRPWFILSALHGVVDPDTVLDPYDVTLKRIPKAARREWGQRVVSQLESRFGSLDGAEFEVHAGDEYVCWRSPSDDTARALR